MLRWVGSFVRPGNGLVKDWEARGRAHTAVPLIDDQVDQAPAASRANSIPHNDQAREASAEAVCVVPTRAGGGGCRGGVA